MLNIHNIIFDLGGVFLDLDVNKTLRSFAGLGFTEDMLKHDQNNKKVFWQFEIGKLTPAQFRNGICDLLGKEIPDNRIDEAWNAMLVRFPEERVALLKVLSNRYNLYMLSNTSALHVKVFEQMYLETAGESMQKVFKKIYYSHEIGWHKPDLEAWEYVLNDAHIKAEETLFLDDNIHNIKASQELGFQAIHIHERIQLMSLGFDL